MAIRAREAEEGSRTVGGRTALVVGGGIAGIQAALDLANARIRVTLVEKGPSLGGRMAQLDKTFPTMDCSI
jgi:heterodisulfide reductase subunit A